MKMMKGVTADTADTSDIGYFKEYVFTILTNFKSYTRLFLHGHFYCPCPTFLFLASFESVVTALNTDIVNLSALRVVLGYQTKFFSVK